MAKEEIRKRLKDARVELELTQEEFGNEMGITRPTVSNLECGYMNSATPKYLKCFEAFHNINPKWLLTDEGEMFLPLKELQLFLEFIENMTPEAVSFLEQEAKRINAIEDKKFSKMQENKLLKLTDKSKEESGKFSKSIETEYNKMNFEKRCHLFLTATLLRVGEAIGAERIISGNTEKCNCKNNWKERVLTIGEHAGEMEQKLIEKEKATNTYKIKK